MIERHLPKELLNTFYMFFDEGKYVNDFRIAGNVIQGDFPSQYTFATRHLVTQIAGHQA